MSGRWDDMRVFLAIANSPSIKQAALHLDTTQSALSKKIDRLEKSLQVKLFERGAKGTKLTYQGQRMLSHALAAEAAITRAEESAKQANARIKGDCSIQVSDGVANYWMVQFLPTFFSQNPDIELKIMLDTSEKANQNEIFDIRMHYMPPTENEYVSKNLATIHFVPFASRSYLERYGTPKTVKDLAEHRLLDQIQYLISRGTWASWFENEPSHYTALFTNQSSFLARAVQAGTGIALMPSYMTIEDESVVPLDVGMHLPLKLYASYRREQLAKAPVRATLSFLRNRMFSPKKMPWFAPDYVAPERRWRLLHAQALLEAQSAPGDNDDELQAAE